MPDLIREAAEAVMLLIAAILVFYLVVRVGTLAVLRSLDQFRRPTRRE